ncbi:tetratricopeptide repeat protein [Dyella japonica]|nr:tetratricopeptide repeat protein [Dyella japonica]
MCGSGAATWSLTRHLAFAAAVAGPVGVASAPMPLFADLTAAHLPITTQSEQARRYFNQGLLLTYGFNHAGAVRSFREAQRLDPGCAVCWWGEALALGPNINAPMDDRDRDTALAAMDRALALRGQASPLERALIDAIAHRYSRDAKADRGALDAAYADAMLEVARRFPNDDDVAVLAAEAAMDTSPWNYWEVDKRTPIGRSGEAVALVEKVLARHPDNLQAAHLYIHLMENSADPRRAEAAADRLAQPLAPSAGHLVHMPAHIYALTGRYADAIRVNVAAARSDEALIRRTDDHSLVRYGYYPHNIHFIVTSAQMTGDMDTAIREARRLRTVLDPDTSARIAWVQAIDAAPYLAMAQFAPPEAILAMLPADARLPYAQAMRLYARAVAHAERQDRAGFDRELTALSALRTSDAFAPMIEQGVPAPDLLSLAEAVARGRFAHAQGRFDEAADHYREAIALERKIPYQEPAYWYYPVSQSLGAALFGAGRYDEASRAFQAALKQTPQNGWALYGLAQSEEALGHKSEAAAARDAFQRAWQGDPSWLRMERL